MPEKFFSSLDKLRDSLGDMGAATGVQLDRAMEAFRAVDHDLANRVMKTEDEIDAMEIKHENQIVNLIARHQPVARDLRLLIACLRVNADIERVGDLAMKIARNTLRIPPGSALFQVDRVLDLAAMARASWTDALHAFAKLDDALAEQVRSRDVEINRVNGQILSGIASGPRATEEQSLVVTNVVAVSKHLERVGDIAVDVSLETIYAARGEQARHARLAETKG